MENYLVSVSDHLVQINPRDLSELEELMGIIASFGFTDSAQDVPHAEHFLEDHPHRLGIFRDDSDQYWLAEYKRQSQMIDLNLIGSRQAVETLTTPDAQARIEESRPYQTLLRHLENHRADLKHDRTGDYLKLYEQAQTLLARIDNGRFTNSFEARETLAECCRQFWHQQVRMKPFDPAEFHEMLPQANKMKNGDFLLIEDTKIAWVANRQEAEAAWDTALDYDEFRSACREFAAWALNVMF